MNGWISPEPHFNGLWLCFNTRLLYAVVLTRRAIFQLNWKSMSHSVEFGYSHHNMWDEWCLNKCKAKSRNNNCHSFSTQLGSLIADIVIDHAHLLPHMTRGRFIKCGSSPLNEQIWWEAVVPGHTAIKGTEVVSRLLLVQHSLSCWNNQGAKGSLESQLHW